MASARDDLTAMLLSPNPTDMRLAPNGTWNRLADLHALWHRRCKKCQRHRALRRSAEAAPGGAEDNGIRQEIPAADRHAACQARQSPSRVAARPCLLAILEPCLRRLRATPSSRCAASLSTFHWRTGGCTGTVAETELSVAAEEFVAIVGPTGCGKTTLLNVTAGLLKPATGRVDIFGKPLEGINSHAGYLFQQDALMPWKTALDNVAISLEVAGVSRREALERAGGWLVRVGLTGFTDRYPHMLSGGQKKRVGLAQVLIRDPKILLMDEPFGPLDAQTRQMMGNLLLRLWAAYRKAVLFVTHDLEEAIALADRVVILSAGPEARIIGDHVIDLGRPRDVADVRTDPRFHVLHKAIWGQLKAEVLKAYGNQSR
jgi:NitT/TauT family transport system ATP-binding protein